MCLSSKNVYASIAQKSVAREKMTEKQKYGSIAEAMNGAMATKNIGLRDLEGRTGISYEHLRKMSKGEATPSPSKLVSICKILDLDLHSMQALEAAQRMQKKYGSISHVIPGRDRDLAKIESMWPKLSKSRRSVVMKLVELLANPKD